MYFSFAFKQGCVGCGLELHLDLRSHGIYLAEVDVKFSTLGGIPKLLNKTVVYFSARLALKKCNTPKSSPEVKRAYD